jgi:hypothetical protein
MAAPRLISASLSLLTLAAFLACAAMAAIPFLLRSGTAEFADEHLESDYAGLGSRYSNNPIQRDRIHYDVLIRDASGAAVGHGMAARAPNGVERVDYLPLAPGIFEFASDPQGFRYFAGSVAFLVIGLLLLFNRQSLLRDGGMSDPRTDPAQSPGTPGAKHKPRQ